MANTVLHTELQPVPAFEMLTVDWGRPTRNRWTIIQRNVLPQICQPTLQERKEHLCLKIWKQLRKFSTKKVISIHFLGMNVYTKKEHLHHVLLVMLVVQFIEHILYWQNFNILLPLYFKTSWKGLFLKSFRIFSIFLLLCISSPYIWNLNSRLKYS